MGDRSIFCRMEVLDRYCAIPGYHRLCCESCTKKASDSNASLASPPTFSTPGSLLPEPTATQEDVKSIRGSPRIEDRQQSQPTQLPGLVDRISSATQHPVTPQVLSARAFEVNSPTTPQSPSWGWTQTAVLSSEGQGQPKEEPGQGGGGTSRPATSPVT